MISRPLQCEWLESRENPVGPLLVDPTGIAVTAAIPANNDSATLAPSAVAPPATTADKILAATIQASLQGW